MSFSSVLIFSVVALSCGWIGRVLDTVAVNPDPSSPGSLGMLIWLVAPLLTAFILRWRRDGWSDFGLSLRLPTRWKAYLVAAVLYPLVFGLVLVLGVGMGKTQILPVSVAPFAWAVLISMPGAIAKNIFEECSWRGYLLPRLYSLGIRGVKLDLWVSLVWGPWHFPYTSVFMEQMGLHESPYTYGLRFMLFIFLSSSLYRMIWEKCRSVWPMVLTHAMGSAFAGVLFTLKPFQVDPRYESVFLPAGDSWIGILVMGAFVLLLNRLKHSF